VQLYGNTVWMHVCTHEMNTAIERNLKGGLKLVVAWFHEEQVWRVDAAKGRIQRLDRLGSILFADQGDDAFDSNADGEFLPVVEQRHPMERLTRCEPQSKSVRERDFRGECIGVDREHLTVVMLRNALITEKSMAEVILAR